MEKNHHVVRENRPTKTYSMDAGSPVVSFLPHGYFFSPMIMVFRGVHGYLQFFVSFHLHGVGNFPLP